MEALLRQTHPKVEIVIVDDGSEEVHVKRLEKFVDSKKDYNKSVKLEKLAKPGQYLGEEVQEFRMLKTLRKNRVRFIFRRR